MSATSRISGPASSARASSASSTSRRCGGSASRSPASSARRPSARREGGSRRSYESYEALLADERVDVVHLTTPNHLHYPQVKQALAAGKHVVCEKPLALTSAESGELLELAERERARALHELQHPLLPAWCRRRGRASGPASSARSGTLHGGYLQDWLLLADRLELAARARPGRGAARGRRHRLALARPRPVRDRPARSRACSPTSRPRSRCGSRPVGEVETFADRRRRRARRRARWRPRTSRTSCCASTAARAARCVVSQVSAGRKNALALRGRRLRSRARLGLRAARGALARPPRRAERDAAARTRPAEPRRRPRARTCRPATPRASRTRSASSTAPSTARSPRASPGRPDYPTFAAGHWRERARRGDRACPTVNDDGWRWTR